MILIHILGGFRKPPKIWVFLSFVFQTDYTG